MYKLTFYETNFNQACKQRKIEKRIQETINAIRRQESRESVAIITSHPRKMADSREAGKSNKY